MSNMNGVQQLAEGLKAVIEDAINPFREEITGKVEKVANEVTEIKGEIICINKRLEGIEGDIKKRIEKNSELEGRIEALEHMV